MTKNKHAIRSDLKKVDAHIIQPDEYDEAPELTDAQIAGATVSFGIRPRGRPKSKTRKEAISLCVGRGCFGCVQVYRRGLADPDERRAPGCDLSCT
jgi:hypothetical protein